MSSRKTKVINLLGGPGCGKTTLSLYTTAFFKMNMLDVELVREYVKKLAWQGIKLDEYDQANIFGRQSRDESMLYGKVDYIVTDSPIHLSAVYDLVYSRIPKCQEAVKQFYKQAEEHGVEHYNFFLQRTKPYKEDGRYETEEQAKERDVQVLEYLKNNSIPYYFVEGDFSGDQQKDCIKKFSFIKQIMF